MREILPSSPKLVSVNITPFGQSKGAKVKVGSRYPCGLLLDDEFVVKRGDSIAVLIDESQVISVADLDSHAPDLFT